MWLPGMQRKRKRKDADEEEEFVPPGLEQEDFDYEQQELAAVLEEDAPGKFTKVGCALLPMILACTHPRDSAAQACLYVHPVLLKRYMLGFWMSLIRCQCFAGCSDCRSFRSSSTEAAAACF